MSKAIIWFDESDALRREAAGGKGVGLGRLTQWGLPVPPGFVVSAETLQEVLDRAGVLDEVRREQAQSKFDDFTVLEGLAQRLQQKVLAAELPPSLRDAIVRAYRQLGSGGEAIPVAVRSSAIAEDSQAASFAGQQETYLDVRGVEPVLERIQACLASLFTSRALFYRAQKDAWSDLALAVVVQTMVQPEKAGILFTRDPVQRRDHIVVEAVWGSGDALASGEAVPDHYEIHRTGRAVVTQRIAPKLRPAPDGSHDTTLSTEPVLTEAELQALVDVGLRAEELFAAPQDIEWAIADQVYLLQSRPITTL